MSPCTGKSNTKCSSYLRFCLTKLSSKISRSFLQVASEASLLNLTDTDVFIPVENTIAFHLKASARMNGRGSSCSSTLFSLPELLFSRNGFHGNAKAYFRTKGRWMTEINPFDVADDGERRAEGVVADVLELNPEEPRVGWRRHLPQGLRTKINL